MAKAYLEPESGPRAKVRFAAANLPSRESVLIYRLNKENCLQDQASLGTLGDKYGSQIRKKLNMPLGENLADNSVTEVYLEAEREMMISMSYWGREHKCTLTTSFSPNAGRMYEYLLTLDHTKGVCDLTIHELKVQENGQYRRTPVKNSMLEKIPKACVPGNIQ